MIIIVIIVIITIIVIIIIVIIINIIIIIITRFQSGDCVCVPILSFESFSPGHQPCPSAILPLAQPADNEGAMYGTVVM